MNLLLLGAGTSGASYRLIKAMNFIAADSRRMINSVTGVASVLNSGWVSLFYKPTTLSGAQVIWCIGDTCRGSSSNKPFAASPGNTWWPFSTD